MKAEIKETEPVFKPVTLEITFETERELKLFTQWIGNTSFVDAIAIANKSTDESYTTIKNFSLGIDNSDVLHQIWLAVSKKIKILEDTK